jgi:hypothetical protein
MVRIYKILQKNKEVNCRQAWAIESEIEKKRKNDINWNQLHERERIEKHDNTKC